MTALALPLALAAVSAIALNWGFFAQHAEAATLPPLTLRRPLGSLALLFSNRRWLTGFLVGIAGWGLYIAALDLGSLSLVQATSAGGIGVLALLVRRISRIELQPREWVGVGLSVGGLSLLGLSLVDGNGDGREALGRAPWPSVAVWMAASAALAALFAGPLRGRLAGGAGLGITAGLLYAAGDIATKAALEGGAMLAFVLALLAAHGSAFVVLQAGFQRGGALATAGVSTLLTNAVPITAGTILFHDPMPAGMFGALRILAFGAVVAGAVLLTRASTAPDRPTAGRRRSGRPLEPPALSSAGPLGRPETV